MVLRRAVNITDSFLARDDHVSEVGSRLPESYRKLISRLVPHHRANTKFWQSLDADCSPENFKGFIESSKRVLSPEDVKTLLKKYPGLIDSVLGALDTTPSIDFMYMWYGVDIRCLVPKSHEETTERLLAIYKRHDEISTEQIAQGM